MGRGEGCGGEGDGGEGVAAIQVMGAKDLRAAVAKSALSPGAARQAGTRDYPPAGEGAAHSQFGGLPGERTEVDPPCPLTV